MDLRSVTAYAALAPASSFAVARPGAPDEALRSADAHHKLLFELKPAVN